MGKAAIPSGGDRAGFVSASTAYPGCRLLYVLPEEVGKIGWSYREVEGGPFGCGTAKTRENSISFRECFMGKLGANVIGQPICRSGLHSYRISLVSIKGVGRWGLGGRAHQRA